MNNGKLADYIIKLAHSFAYFPRFPCNIFFFLTLINRKVLNLQTKKDF